MAAPPTERTEADSDFRVLDLVHDSVVVLDLDDRILVWNTAAEALYGWTRGEAVGQSAGTLLSADPVAYEGARKLFQTTAHWQGEASRRTRDGQILIVDVRRTLRRDARGEPLHVVESGRDLTAKKAEEARYRHIEHRYRNLFQALAASIWEVDFSPIDDVLRELLRDGITDFRAHFAQHPQFVRRLMSVAQVVDVNDRTVGLFGRGDKQELLGNSDRFWAEGSEPVFAAGVLAGIAKKAGYASEVKLRTIDGRIVDALMSISYPAESLGKGTLVVGVIDLSEQKRADEALRLSEARYRALFHNVPLALAQIDTTAMASYFDEVRARGVTDLVHFVENDPHALERIGDLVCAQEVNEAARELFGVADRAQLLGPVGWAWRASPATLRRSLAARMRGADRFTEQTKMSTPDGRTVDIVYYIAFNSELADLGINVVAFVDVRERLRAEALLEQTRSEFAHSARVSMLGELTASLAHELNQPLTGILTGASTASRWMDREPPALDEVRSTLARVKSDARRAADIIARARSMASNAGTERLDVPINVAVEEAIQFLRYESSARGMRLVLDLSPSAPHVRIDRVQIQQVIVNLAVNAMQAMEQAPGRASVVTLRTLREEDLAVVRVEDSGPGIGTDAVDRLFQSFFTTKTHGMGMGLRICRSIIEAHDGTIDAANHPDGGAVFAFRLPAAR